MTDVVLARLTRLLVSLVFLLMAAPGSHAQAPAAISLPPQNLRDFEGIYDYRDGLTLFMVAREERLFAIIDESKYPLRGAGSDTFTNSWLGCFACPD